MAEQPSGGRIAGWIKAACSAVFGLLSGAALMYVSPLVDRVIKPSPPVANFAVELQGAQATFQNRSTGGHDGWWDFGDGSPLEPFSPDQQRLPHAYPRPGSYTAKLSLRSLLGDQNERSVPVQIDGPAAGPAEITAFQVANTRADAFAPATFRVVGKVKNAELCVWSDGPGQPMQVQPKPPDEQERYVTFTRPGSYTLRLAAVQGTQVVERSEVVKVEAPRPGVAMAVLNVTREMARMETTRQHTNIPVEWPANAAGNAWAFKVEVPALDRWQIASATLKDWCLKSPAVKDPKVAVSPDRTKLILTGQLLKQGGGILKRTGNSPTKWVAGVDLAMQRRAAPAVQGPESVATLLKLDGPTVLTIPQAQGAQVVRQMLSLDVTDGSRPTPQRLTVPASGTVLLQNQPWQLTATQQGNQVRIDLRALRSGAALSGN
jgi:hypothetical protein